MGFAQWIDWMEEREDYDRWQNHGRRVRRENCNHYDDEKILQVVERTVCTVMENTETGEWFLTLCGGGMDLSQDIALAYHIMDKWLPLELLQRVCTQPGLSISKEEFRTIGAIIVEQAEIEKQRFARLEEEWKEKIGLVEIEA